MKVGTLIKILLNYPTEMPIYMGLMKDKEVIQKKIDYAEYSGIDNVITLWSEDDA